jgi:hypothetical protein
VKTVKCSVCSTETSTQADYCLRCGASNWVTEETSEDQAFDAQSQAMFGFDEPADLPQPLEVHYTSPASKLWLRWVSIAAISALVTVGAIWVMQHGLINFDGKQDAAMGENHSEPLIEPSFEKTPYPQASYTPTASPSASASASASAAPKPSASATKPAATKPPVATTWPIAGFKPVDGFASFAYKPVNDYCSVGTICAKFKVATKATCSRGAAVTVMFLDPTGKIVDTVSYSVGVRAGSPVLFEADTDATNVSGWQISNIYCK